MRMLYLTLICGILMGCSSIMKLLPTSGGVAANGQIGKENTQEVISNDTELNAEVINQVTNQDIPIEFMLLMILGWLAPSPAEIWRGFLKLIGRDTR